MKDVCVRLANRINRGGVFVLVVGDVTRGRGPARCTATLTERLLAKEAALASFQLVWRIEDLIPDIRRSRRECNGTKQETVLVYEKR